MLRLKQLKSLKPYFRNANCLRGCVQNHAHFLFATVIIRIPLRSILVDIRLSCVLLMSRATNDIFLPPERHNTNRSYAEIIHGGTDHPNLAEHPAEKQQRGILSHLHGSLKEEKPCQAIYYTYIYSQGKISVGILNSCRMKNKNKAYFRSFFLFCIVFFPHKKTLRFRYATRISSAGSRRDRINACCYQYLTSSLRERGGGHLVGVVE